MAKTKFYNVMDGNHPLSRKQKALYDYLFSIINKEVILLVSKDDGKDYNVLDVVNGDSFLALNQNGLAVCDTFENENGGIGYYVVCFYDTSDVKEYEKTTWDISRHPEQGENFDGLGHSDLIIIDNDGNLLKCSQKTSLFESKKSKRKSLKESRKKGYIRKTEYEIDNRNYSISDNGKLFKIIDDLDSKGFVFKYESEWISKDTCKHFLADDDKAKVDLYK